MPNEKLCIFSIISNWSQICRGPNYGFYRRFKMGTSPAPEKASIKPLFGPLQICDQFEMIENMHSFHLVYYKIIFLCWKRFVRRKIVLIKSIFQFTKAKDNCDFWVISWVLFGIDPCYWYQIKAILMYNQIKNINDSYRHNMSEQYERNVHVKCAFFFL